MILPLLKAIYFKLQSSGNHEDKRSDKGHCRHFEWQIKWRQRYVNGNKCKKLSLWVYFQFFHFSSRSPEKERTKFHASVFHFLLQLNYHLPRSPLKKIYRDKFSKIPPLSYGQYMNMSYMIVGSTTRIEWG